MTTIKQLTHDRGAGARQTIFSAQGAAGAAMLILLAAGGANAQSVEFDGAKFVNQGLVGVARVPSNARDKFGDTLGGFGSGMAMDFSSWHEELDGSYVGSLYMLPDKGWNTQGTVDYPGRLHRFEATLKPFYGTKTSAQNQLTLDYKTSVMFHQALGVPTTGLDATAVRSSYTFPDLPVAPDARITLDDEAVVYPGDGTIWVSDEYGPYVYHYTTAGALIGVIRPPAAFIPMRKNASGNVVENFSANSPPIGQTYNTGNPVSGRQNNQGFEGLAMSPDRKTLFVLLQSALIQDLNPSDIKHTRRNTRLLAYDLWHGEPTLIGEYAVQLPLYQDQTTTTPSLLIAAQSELHALNDHQFLVLARDSSVGESYPATPGSVYRSIDLIDISKATNIANTKYDQTTPIAPLGVLDPSIEPAAYKKFLDVNNNTQLHRFGLHNGAPANSNDLYEKWESIGIAPVGDAKAPHDYFMFVGSDNDFITQDGFMAGKPYTDASGYNIDTLVLVFRVTLPTYVAPEKTSEVDKY